MRMNFTVPSFKSIPVFTGTSLLPRVGGAAAFLATAWCLRQDEWGRGCQRKIIQTRNSVHRYTYGVPDSSRDYVELVAKVYKYMRIYL